MVTLAAVAITLALFGSLSHTSRHDAALDAGAPVLAAKGHGGAGRLDGGSPASTRHLPSGLALGADRAPVSAAEVALQASLARTLRSAGPGAGALVYDLSDRAELFALRPAVKRPPASVEKLWTTTAVLNRLGPDARLHTSVLGTGSLRDGVWRGNLYLRGGGDPTFGDPTFNRVWEQGYGPSAAQLASQLSRRGIKRVTGSVFADESLFDRRRGGMMTGLDVDVPDFGGQLSALTYDHGTTVKRFSPATFAAHQLVATMRSSRISAKAAAATAVTPRRARLLAIVGSPPMSAMIRLMDVPSDDLFAELLAKQLGILFGGAGTIAAGAHVISQTIAAGYDLHPRILDGSGLSRQDRSSPLEVVDLLRELWPTAVGRELQAALPTVGVNGTVQTIGVKTAAQGHCVAKTGTLDGVTNLAGYCRSRRHHALAFALFIDGPVNYVALALESRMIAAIARY